MNIFQTYADKTAISLSLLCAIHCIAFPLAVIALPAVAALNLDGEAFHLWMLVAVIPISLLALTLGCSKHKNHKVLTLGLIGLALLVFAGVLGHDVAGEVGEKSLTLVGACVVASGHFLNHRLCRQSECECHA